MIMSNWPSRNTKKTGKTDLNSFLPASFAFLLLLTGGRVSGQGVTVHGAVYNAYGTKPLEAATVLSTSGRITMTDSNGNYVIVVRPTDSIWFSYLGRSTHRFPVNEIKLNDGFYVSLQVDPVVLKEVKVTPRDYRADSLQNRKDYYKYFNYKKPTLHVTPGVSGGGLGVSINIDTLIYMFEFNKIRRAKGFQKRLINDEHEKYVDHRFARSVVLWDLASTRRIFAPGAITCAHSTSRAVSIELDPCAGNVEPPVSFTLVKLGGSARWK